MSEQVASLVDSCQPTTWLKTSTKHATINGVETTEDERQAKALTTLSLLVEMSGSLQKACAEIKERTGLTVTPEGLRKAIKAKRVGDHLQAIADALVKTSRLSAFTTESGRVIEYDDPYPDRPAAIALLRGKVDTEVLDALRLVSNSAKQVQTVEQWVEEARVLQRLREGIDVGGVPQDEIPSPPAVSREALQQRRKR